MKLSQVIGRIDIEGKSGSLHYRRVQTELSRAVQVPPETIRSEREIEGDRRIEAQTIGPLPVAVRRERYRMRRYCTCKLSEILRAQQRQVAGNRQHGPPLWDESAEFLPHWADSPAPVPEFVFDQRLGW